MNLSIERKKNGELVIQLEGEIDHHSARGCIPKILSTIDTQLPQRIKLDFEHIKFMDSSGIAIVIGAFKHAKALLCDFSVVNVPPQAYKVFLAAGVCKLIDISKKTKDTLKI